MEALHPGYRRRTSDKVSRMLRRCTFAGCSALTLGGTCVIHDSAPVSSFPRGRPFARLDADRELATISR